MFLTLNSITSLLALAKGAWTKCMEYQEISSNGGGVWYKLVGSNVVPKQVSYMHGMNIIILTVARIHINTIFIFVKLPPCQDSNLFNNRFTKYSISEIIFVLHQNFILFHPSPFFFQGRCTQNEALLNDGVSLNADHHIYLFRLMLEIQIEI